MHVIYGHNLDVQKTRMFPPKNRHFQDLNNNVLYHVQTFILIQVPNPTYQFYDIHTNVYTKCKKKQLSSHQYQCQCPHEQNGSPPWSNGSVLDHRSLTTNHVRISAWAYLKGVSFLNSLRYLSKSLGPLRLPCIQKSPKT